MGLYYESVEEVPRKKDYSKQSFQGKFTEESTIPNVTAIDNSPYNILNNLTNYQFTTTELGVFSVAWLGTIPKDFIVKHVWVNFSCSTAGSQVAYMSIEKGHTNPILVWEYSGITEGEQVFFNFLAESKTVADMPLRFTCSPGIGVAANITATINFSGYQY